MKSKKKRTVEDLKTNIEELQEEIIENRLKALKRQKEQKSEKKEEKEDEKEYKRIQQLAMEYRKDILAEETEILFERQCEEAERLGKTKPVLENGRITYKFDIAEANRRKNKHGWHPLPIVRVKKEPPKLLDYTQRLIKSLTPSIPESKYTGGIKTRIGTIIARMGYGKSETVKQIYKEVIKVYGEDRVNCIASMHIKPLIDNFDEKPVQLLFLDDSTGLEKKDQKAMMKHIIRIRHTLEKAQKAREKTTGAGVIILIISSHSFFMLQKEVRTLFNFLIMKSYDSNAYNQRIMRQEFGQYGVQELEKLTKQKEIDDDMSALNTSIISMIGQKKGGYIHFDYDPEEASKECWRWIDYQNGFDESPKTHTFKNIIKEYKQNEDWGNFHEILEEECKKIPIEKYQPFGIRTDVNLTDSLYVWFCRYFLALDDAEINEKLGEDRELNITSINQYCTRINNVLKGSIGDIVKPKVSERWLTDSLNEIFLLSPQRPKRAVWQCEQCTSKKSKQKNDVCLHDQNKRLLSINVKWKINKGLHKEESTTPEYYSQPHAILFIDTRTGKGRGTRIRYKKLAKKEQTIKVKEIPIITKKDRGNILDAVLEDL